MKDYIRGRLEKAVHTYDDDNNSRSLMDFIQINVCLLHVLSFILISANHAISLLISSLDAKN